MSFELSDKKWQLTLSDGRRGPSRYSVDAGDTAAVTQCIAKAKERCKVNPQAMVHSCYEAGRDGWWLHRWLVEQGVDNIVVDSSSLEVNRHARRAKTDRIDGASCCRCFYATAQASVFGRYCTNQQRRTKTPVARTASWHDWRMSVPHTRTALVRFWCCTTCDRTSSLVDATGHAGGTSIARKYHRQLRAEIERESARLALVKQQVKAMEMARRQELADGKQPWWRN